MRKVGGRVTKTVELRWVDTDSATGGDLDEPPHEVRIVWWEQAVEP